MGECSAKNRTDRNSIYFVEAANYDEWQSAGEIDYGVTPEDIWKDMRMMELIKCIARHSNTVNCEDVMEKWLDELTRLLNERRKND